MLRVSATTTETEIDLAGINGDAEAAGIGIQYGAELVQFAESAARRDAEALATSRTALLQAAGPAVLVDAAGVAANFQRMVRIADATGIPVDDMTGEIGVEVRTTLSLDRFAGAEHSRR